MRPRARRGAGPGLAGAWLLLSTLLGGVLGPAAVPHAVAATPRSAPRALARPGRRQYARRPGSCGTPPPARRAPAAELTVTDAVAPQDPGRQATLETRQPDVQWSPRRRGRLAERAHRQAVTAGDRVRTGPAASARLVYFEGTVTEVGAETGLLVQRLERGADGNIVASFFQSVGSTVSRVVHGTATAADFSVETPAASAFVRGTTPRVIVADDGTTRIANVPDGADSIVVIQGKDPNRSEVRLPPGLQSLVRPASRPARPPPLTPPPRPCPVPPPTSARRQPSGSSSASRSSSARGRRPCRPRPASPRRRPS